jgi:hypothetical protein
LAAADKKTEERPLMGSLAFGMAAGLGTAWVLTAKMDPDRGPAAPVNSALPHDVSAAIVPLDHGAAFALLGAL